MNDYKCELWWFCHPELGYWVYVVSLTGDMVVYEKYQDCRSGLKMRCRSTRHKFAREFGGEKSQ